MSLDTVADACDVIGKTCIVQRFRQFNHLGNTVRLECTNTNSCADSTFLCPAGYECTVDCSKDSSMQHHGDEFKSVKFTLEFDTCFPLCGWNPYCYGINSCMNMSAEGAGIDYPIRI